MRGKLNRKTVTGTDFRRGSGSGSNREEIRASHRFSGSGSLRGEIRACPRFSTLLHNMSCTPDTQIRHQSPYRRLHGRGIIFALGARQELPEGMPGSGVSREEELRRRIEAHARDLPLPAAALVTDRAEPEDEKCTDLLSIITVLSKSSAHVYLRDKIPNLNQIKPGRRVVLIVPGERTPQ